MVAKKYDESGRWRNIYVGFRVSDEEKETIMRLAGKYGMEMRAYIMDALKESDITVRPNHRVYEILRPQLAEMYEKLSLISRTEESESINKVLRALKLAL